MITNYYNLWNMAQFKCDDELWDNRLVWFAPSANDVLRWFERHFEGVRCGNKNRSVYIKDGYVVAQWVHDQREFGYPIDENDNRSSLALFECLQGYAEEFGIEGGQYSFLKAHRPRPLSERLINLRSREGKECS